MQSAGSRSLACALLYLAGTVWVQTLSELPSPWAALLLFPLAAGACRWVFLRWMFVPVLAIVAAVLRAHIALGGGLPPEWEGDDLVAEGVVASIPQSTAGGVLRFRFAVSSLYRDGRRADGPGSVLLSWYEPPPGAPSAGEHWRLVVRLKRPRGVSNPGAFDYETYLYRQGLRATGYVRGNTGQQRLAPASPWSLLVIRAQLARAIENSVQDPSAPLLAALAVGSRSNISAQQWEVLRRTGTSHLLAISGLHVGLAASMGFLLGGGLWRLSVHGLLWRPARHAAAITSLVAALAYAALAGFAVPTQRALIMVAVLMAALLACRTVTPSHVFALALIGVLVLDPLAVLDPGFWLSFVAVGVILICLATRPGSRRRWLWLRVQWVLTLVLAPFVLGFFGQVSLASPVANVIAIPVVAFGVVPLVLAGVIAHLSGLDVAGGWSWQAAGWLLSLLWPVLEKISSVEFSAWRSGTPSPVAMTAAVVGMTLILMPRGSPARWLAPIWLLPLILPPGRLPQEAFSVTVLDVGQGLSVVVETREHVLVYDTGARFRSGNDMGRMVVLPYLRQRGYRRVDTLVISHGDNDHIGGSRSVLDAIPVAYRRSSVPGRIPGARPCIAGERWVWDGVVFSFLHPAAAAPPPHNNSSCVLQITAPGGTALLTGDIEASAEHELLQRRAGRLTADLLLVPHQGSRTSSSPAFLDAVAPGLAVVSAGYHNQYGHPHKEIVARYRQRDIRIFNTALSGAVRIVFDQKGPRISEYRRDTRRYWMDE